MVFSYLEPVLHKAQLVLGGGRCLKIFSYSFPRAVAMSGTQLSPLECPQPERVPGRPLRLRRWWAFRHKKGRRQGCRVSAHGLLGAPGRFPE